MAQIKVTQKNTETFEVTVRASTTTTHTVTLEAEYYQKLTSGKVTLEILIENSFEFQLEHESNTSNLSIFNSPLLGRCLPAYEIKIVKRF